MGNRIRNFEVIVWALVVVILIGLVVSIVAYRSIFDGGLSELSTDWGAIGSFFGGIFSPIIAFAMLIAIIVTIKLQKQLLATQVIEFEKMYQIQNATLTAQRSELELSKKHSFEQALNEQKKLFLGLIEQQMNIRRAEMVRASEGVIFLLEQQEKGIPIEKSIIESNAQQKETLERQLQVLTFVSIGFALQRFDSTEKMDSSIARLFQLIDNPVNLNAMYASKGKDFNYQ